MADYMNASDYADAMDCVAFWRKCAEHPMPEDDSSDVMRWLSHEMDATCEAIGFASR